MGNSIKKCEITKNYKMHEVLGTGSFATVKRGRRIADKKDFAIKVIKKNKLNAEELAVVHDEVEIMHKISHPNCVKLFEMYESSKKVYMVLELLTGGELFDSIVSKGSYSEKDAAAVIRSIAAAIKYLHSIGVVHRDLKPENLIYESPSSDSKIKITDFGLAKFNKTQGSMATACGTPGYVAPEVLRNEAYGAPVDLWSLGVILYILLCGFPPFFHESTSQLYRQIKKGQYSFPDPYWSDISQQAKSLVEGLLTVDAAKRFTPDDVLKHPWIDQTDQSSKDLGAGFRKRLALSQAKKTLRKGVHSIIALNKFKNSLNDLMTK